MQALNANETVGQLASTHPLSVKVFQRRGIDFCCGGGKTLEAVCQARGLDAAQVLAEIEAEEARSAPNTMRWDERPLNELIGYILKRFHEPLPEELARVEAMARKVHRVHGSKDPERLGALMETVVALREELEPHLMKEERVLFPWILSGNGTTANAPVQVMMSEHESTGEQLARIRELTGGFTIPPQACGTWRALWQGLEALEAELHEHIHLENNILFPRALRGG